MRTQSATSQRETVMKRFVWTDARQSSRPTAVDTGRKCGRHGVHAGSIVVAMAAVATAVASLCACGAPEVRGHHTVTTSPPVACGAGAAPACSGPTTAPTDSSTASRVAAPVITDGDGLLFTVAAAAPTRASSVTVGGLDRSTLVAPASYYFAHSVLTVTNRQAFAVPLDSLVAGGGSGSVTVGLPPSPLPAGFDCHTSENGYTAPNGLCQVTGAIFPGVSSVGVDLILPDGYAVTAGTNPSVDGEQPMIPASGTAVLNLYAGPFPIGYASTGMRVLFGIGLGPKMVALA